MENSIMYRYSAAGPAGWMNISAKRGLDKMHVGIDRLSLKPIFADLWQQSHDEPLYELEQKISPEESGSEIDPLSLSGAFATAALAKRLYSYKDAHPIETTAKLVSVYKAANDVVEEFSKGYVLEPLLGLVDEPINSDLDAILDQNRGIGGRACSAEQFGNLDVAKKLWDFCANRWSSLSVPTIFDGSYVVSTEQLASQAIQRSLLIDIAPEQAKWPFQLH